MEDKTSLGIQDGHGLQVMFFRLQTLPLGVNAGSGLYRNLWGPGHFINAPAGGMGDRVPGVVRGFSTAV